MARDCFPCGDTERPRRIEIDSPEPSYSIKCRATRATSVNDPTLHPGTILITSGQAWLSRFIRSVTCSPYSHGSIVAHISRFDLRRHRSVRRWTPRDSLVSAWEPADYLVESTTINPVPCEILKKSFAGVQVHRLRDSVDAYRGRVWCMRPVTPFSPSESMRLTEVLLDLVGTEYDTAGAMTAGTVLLKRWLLAPLASDRSRTFCIEMVAVALLYALQGRVLPEIRPGELSPAGMVRLLVSSGLYWEPERIK